VQKEYVTVPAALLVRTDELAAYLRVSFDYAATLKPKATKRTGNPEPRHARHAAERRCRR